MPSYLGDSKVFTSPFAADVPMGYEYTAGLTETSPPDTVLLEDKFSAHAHQRVVVLVDGSGSVSKAP